MNYKFLCIAFFLCTTFSSLAQDDDTNQKLNKDLLQRFPETTHVEVVWRSLSYGYMAFYSITNQPRMSLYDGDGRFKGSYKQESWETRVSEIIKTNFDNSPYYTYSVIVFWEKETSGYKTYFLEMQDREGVSKEAWFDENGKFSATPFR